MSQALEHYLQHAASVYVPRFDAWFPTTFDWERLCADVPDMARRLGTALPEHEDERDLVAAAQVVFRAGHLCGLALLAAVAEGTADPSELLERAAQAPGEDEEQYFDELVGTCLGPIETQLGGESVPGEDAPDGVERGILLYGAVWPAVSRVLAADESRVFERAGEAAGVLWGVARVGVVLAALRWMAVGAYDLDWPDPQMDG